MGAMLGALSLLVFVVWVVLRPSAGMALFMYALTVQLALYLLGSTTGLARITSTALVAAGLVRLLSTRSLRVRLCSLDLVWVLLTTWMCISVLWTADESSYRWTKLMEWFITASIFYALPRAFLTDLDETKQFGTTMMFAGGVLAVFGVYLHLTGQLEFRGGRVWTFGNPLGLARLAWLAVLSAVYVLLRGPASLRLISIAVALAGAWLALATGSRGPLASGVLAGAVLWLTLRGRARIWGAVVLGVFVSVFLVAVLDLVPSESLERLATLKSAGTDTAGRGELYAAAWDQGIRSGGLGGGVGSFHTVGGHQYPHNLFLELWGEFGVLGVALMVWMLSSATRRGIRIYRAAKGNRPAILTLAWATSVTVFGLLQSMTTADLPQQYALWMGLGMLACPAEAFLHSPQSEAAQFDGYELGEGVAA